MINAIRAEFCECGCGKKLLPATRCTRYHPARFLPGHINKGRVSHHRYIPKPEEIPSGLCECGCGRKTTIAKATFRRRRHFFGHPTPFIRGHRIQKHAEAHWNFTGKRVRHGYLYLYRPEHPHARRGYVAEHRVVMEDKLGRYLEPHETVHHINGNALDNCPENLQLRSKQHGPGVALCCGDCGSKNVIHIPLL